MSAALTVVSSQLTASLSVSWSDCNFFRLC